MFDRIRQGIARTRQAITSRLGQLLGGRALDAASLEEIETALLQADVGVAVTARIIGVLKQNPRAAEGGALELVKDYITGVLAPCQAAFPGPGTQAGPIVVLVVGVNGVGKTTTIGKLAKSLQEHHHSVVLAAGDTFRAAAIEQLQGWGERIGAPVVAQQIGADSASVIFDAFSTARARAADYLLADTAGRLHTKDTLMNELKKIKRVLAKQDPAAPHETTLVLDATIGQNAIAQVRTFHEAIGLDSLIVTKLDGTARGGIVIALADQFGLPIRFIGLGEAPEDLEPFDARAFVDALFSVAASEP